MNYDDGSVRWVWGLAVALALSCIAFVSGTLYVDLKPVPRPPVPHVLAQAKALSNKAMDMRMRALYWQGFLDGAKAQRNKDQDSLASVLKDRPIPQYFALVKPDHKG